MKLCVLSGKGGVRANRGNMPYAYQLYCNIMILIASCGAVEVVPLFNVKGGTKKMHYGRP